MLKTRKDAAVMFWVGIALAVVLGIFVDPGAALVGVVWAVIAGVQWALYVNRDLQRQKD